MPKTSLPIVAIGASAGGLEAMQEFLMHIPSNTGMVFVYVQHLNRSHASNLTSIFSRFTQMPVIEAENEMELQEDRLYVIPPDKELTINNGYLKLDQRPVKPYANMPINKFFHSLAQNVKQLPIGIILSGAASDGIMGLKEIKLAGGITFAHGDTAQFSSMPQGAVDEGAVDMVLSPKEMAEEIKRIAGEKNTYQTALQKLNEDGISNRDQSLIGILHLIHKSVGVDFKFYKMSTIKRRILRRMMLHQLETLESYAQYLKQHAKEVNLLYHDLLINVTTFFRDQEASEYLKLHLIPHILKDKEPNDPIRIWVPACSTGQEVYSIAILLVEALGEKVTSTSIQIFATDISEKVITKARMGIYTQNEVADVPPKRLQRFFVKKEGNYQIVKNIRDLCVFATHNITKDPPFSHLDLISCCNLLIYLDNFLQKKVIATFHYALKNSGYLILGKSETTGTSGFFTLIDKKAKIYSKKNDSSAKARFEMSFRIPELDKHPSPTGKRPEQKKYTHESNMDKVVDNLLLTRYVPASVLVNNDLDILQFRGAIGQYLEPTPGKASLNLLKMARTGLGFELRNIIHKASQTDKPVKKTGLEITRYNTTHKVSIEAIQIKLDTEEHFYLVVFEDMPEISEELLSTLKDNAQSHQLERELTALREDMKAIVESQEAANEELQSANEEIVSSNEELQSINEELETSKEELESSNEELITINQELQLRNEELAEAQEYSNSFFNTIRESLLILDFNLRVKSANQTFYNTFLLKEEEIEGTPIFELSNRQWNSPQLQALIYELLPQQSFISGYEITHTFPTIGEKVLLINACKITKKETSEQITLLAIEDITEHRKVQKMLIDREAWMRNMADNAPTMIWVSGPDKLNSFVNKAFLEWRGIQQDYAIGKLWTHHIHPDDLQRCMKTYESCFKDKTPYTLEYRLLRHDGQYRWVLDNAKPNFTPEGQFTGFIGSCIDIHDQHLTALELEKRIEERTQALVEANNELERSHSELQQFAYVASHDLQEPLRKIMLFIDRLKEGYSSKLTDGAEKYFDKINYATKHMSQLLDDLLNFSRISKLNKRFIKTDLNDILHNVISDLKYNITEKKAEIKTEALPEIQAIPIQIAQLFHNLLSNSLKFSKPDEHPVIHIFSTKLSTPEKEAHHKLDPTLNYCKIVVKDNGIGIKEEYVDQIFNIFQRLHNKGQYSGTGIGLSLCRKIVTNHNGEINAMSKENDGAEFEIILPLRQFE